jgi:hypothetical protein
LRRDRGMLTDFELEESEEEIDFSEDFMDSLSKILLEK